MQDNFYALDKFEELDKVLGGIIEALPIKRKARRIQRRRNGRG